MASEPPRYVVIDTRGRAENVKDGYGWFEILDWVYAQHTSAGGSTPLPDILLKDGKIIVPRRITDIAWEFCRKKRDRIDAAISQTKQEFPEPKDTPDAR